MSKEQTPITYVIDLVNPNDITHRNNCIIRQGCDWTESEKEIIQKALNGDLITEEEAQAKVLEALEIVKTLTDNNVSITSEHIDNLIRSKTKV